MSSPAAIVISGITAAGKTTLANTIVSYVPFPVLSPAALEESLRQSRTGSDNASDLRAAAYEALFDQCRSQLASGESVLIDAALKSPQLWQQLRQICTETGAKLLPLVLDCPAEVAAERIRLKQEAEPDYEPGKEAPEEVISALSSLDFPLFHIDATVDADTVAGAAITIIDTALERWEPIPCGDPEEN